MFNPHALVEDNKSTCVVLLDPSLPPTATFQSVVWPDPGTGADRLYLLHQHPSYDTTSKLPTTKTTICELQSFSSDYASFLVPGDDSALVIGRNSDLMCVTPVDPLWFLLAQACPAPNDDATVKLPWQPMDQLWASLSSTSATSQHDDNDDEATTTIPSLESILLQTKDQALAWYDAMELDPDTMVYKFVPQRVLDWLVCKHAAVQTVLERQAAHSKATANTGAFASSFVMPEDVSKRTTQQSVVVSPSSSQETNNTTAVTNVDATVRRESLQIVCSYLTEAWRAAFLTHIGESLDALDSNANAKKRRVTVDGSVDASAVSASATMTYMTTGQGAAGNNNKSASQASNSKLTLQQKKLSKVNTKGMSKISSFFGAAAKKK